MAPVPFFTGRFVSWCRGVLPPAFGARGALAGQASRGNRKAARAPPSAWRKRTPRPGTTQRFKRRRASGRAEWAIRRLDFAWRAQFPSLFHSSSSASFPNTLGHSAGGRKHAAPSAVIQPWPRSCPGGAAARSIEGGYTTFSVIAVPDQALTEAFSAGMRFAGINTASGNPDIAPDYFHGPSGP